MPSTRYGAFAGLAILCGLLLTVCGASVAAWRLSPVTFAMGAPAYALLTGFSYAVSTAMVLEVIGGRQRLAATGYSVLSSVSNLPVVYMSWLCGSAYQYIGVRGPMAFNALANAVAAVVLRIFMVWSAQRKSDWALHVPLPTPRTTTSNEAL